MYIYVLCIIQVQEIGGRPIHFPRFSLAVFDLPTGRSTEEWNREVLISPKQSPPPHSLHFVYL